MEFFKTNFKGRLRNTDLPKTHGLFPMFEAVINSIHALEENQNLANGKIIITIQRESQTSLINDGSYYPDIVNFLIEDNGIGFNDSNLSSFSTLDSEHKIAKGCRGVGRLLWLKAFSHVEIDSHFYDADGNIKRRTLEFNAQGVTVKDVELTSKEVKTHIILHGFEKTYRASTPKGIEAIARALLEHCLWYFVRPEGVPTIILGDSNEVIVLNELYSGYMTESSDSETVAIKGQDFTLTHLKFRASSKKHSLSLCAAGRLVKEEFISGKISGLHGKLADNHGEFTYSCYVASPFLDDMVRAERTGFNIAEESNDIFSEVGLKDIREQVLSQAKSYLTQYLEKNIESGRKRINDFANTKAPRYRPVLHHLKEDEWAIDPTISDRELDLLLHKYLANLERNMIKQGHEIMSSFNSDMVDYQERLTTYLKAAEDIKKSDLANYVTHRRVIIDLLEKSIQLGDSDKYARENIIHKLIMPMGKESSDLFNDECNLWLIDERLAFHNYLASDKTLNAMPITGDKSTKEPDILALNVYDNPILVSDKQVPPLASLTVIEIKRPMRNDVKSGEEKNPIEQALGYLNRIRAGNVKTANGRPIPNSTEIPGYCYIICDLTPSMKEQCGYLDLTITSDYMGYFGYNKYHKSYIEVISYDKLVLAAKERNRAFFDKLGLPNN